MLANHDIPLGSVQEVASRSGFSPTPSCARAEVALKRNELEQLQLKLEQMGLPRVGGMALFAHLARQSRSCC